MKVELKEIIDQLSEAIHLSQYYKVSALIDDENDNKIVGWTVVRVFKDGTIKPATKNFKDLKELINTYMN